VSGAAEATGSVNVALEHARRLLQRDPALALEQAGEILKGVPGHPMAMLVTGIAQRSLGDLPAALETLRGLAATQPRSAATHFEYGQTLLEAGQNPEAVAAIRRALELKPDLPDAWRVLGDALRASGHGAGADAAYANHIRAATRDPKLIAAASALVENRLPEAERRLRQHLENHPSDVAALRMLAEVAARRGRYSDAEELLTRCLELAPSFHEARHNYAIVLHRMNKVPQALAEVDRLLALEPHSGPYRNLKAVVLAKVGEFAESLDLFASVLKASPRQARIWMSYGHALSTAGREADSIQAYRRCIELLPQCGEAWWSLANLKTFRFTDAEVATMRRELARADLGAEDRFHLHFALGKALEDAQQYEPSFEHYAEGNRLRAEQLSYSAAATSALVAVSKTLFTPEFFSARAGWGATAPDPVFIVGLPRAGSTLIEQILASHSQVEGTMELPNIFSMAGKLVGRGSEDLDARYAAAQAAVHRQDAQQLPAPGLHPPDPAAGEDHRRPPPPDGLRVLAVQAALRPRPELQLLARGHRPLLLRLRRADGALRRRAARARVPGHSRATDRGHRSAGARATGLLRAGFRGVLPAFLRERAGGAHRQRPAGAPPHLTGRRGPMASLRTLAGSLARGPGSGPGGLSGSARILNLPAASIDCGLRARCLKTNDQGNSYDSQPQA
jgi:predicted Zn-dependent protease